MKVFRTKEFTGSRSWEAIDVASMQGITTRIHWTKEPYRWHVNDGEEVFAVLSGEVDMLYREAGVEHTVALAAGDVFHASCGTEHIACPRGEARILVVESEGSV